MIFPQFNLCGDTIMRDSRDTKTLEIEAFSLPKTPGRKRVYASAADRQRAYRERKRSGQVHTETVTENVTAELSHLRAQLAKMETERDSWKRCYTSACKSIEALAVERDKLSAQVQALQADNAELMRRLDAAETARDQYRRSFELIEKREFQTRKRCDEKLALAQSRVDRLTEELQRRESELESALSKPKKRNVTKKGKGDFLAPLREIAAFFDHPVPEMKKMGRYKLDELILSVSSD
jgi:chromosome segregation ATPase